MERSISGLEQLRQKKITVFQNRMIYALCYLFNSFDLGVKLLLFNEKKRDQLKLPKHVEVGKERLNGIMNTITKVKNDGLKTSVDGREITLYNAQSLLRDKASGKINGSKFKKEYNNTVGNVDAIP